MDQLEDFESFLKNVDQISELVKDLKSSDVAIQQKAIETADGYIAELDEPCRTTVNKTTINTNTPGQPSLGLQNRNPDNFMRIMERDVEDRSLRRIAKANKAHALKDKGNEAYAQEDYETAVKYYSDGLTELRDIQPLYTNRAQAYIKLGKYKEAISDCEWALKCNEGCIKAYLHMGKAYLALKKYNESRKCFEKMTEIEPAREKMVKGTGQTLFRLNNGFSIIGSNDTVRSCLLQETKDPGCQELCVSALKLWRVICCGNDENQKMLITCPVIRRSIVDLVTAEHVAVREECLTLLSLYSQTPHGRRLVIDNLNGHKFVRSLMACILKPKKQQQQNSAVKILENFAAENKLPPPVRTTSGILLTRPLKSLWVRRDRFCLQLRGVLKESVIVPFTTLLANISESNRQVLPSLISAVGCLARDDVIRHKLAHDPECWKAFVVAIRQCSASDYKEILYPMLGLIINLSTITSPIIKEHAVSLCDCTLGLLRDSDGEVITRATGMLSTVLPQSPEAVQHVVQGGVVRLMLPLLKGTGQTATKYAIKTLTLCTAVSQSAREELVQSDKKLSVLRRLLASSCDEMVSGNAALCLAHLLELEGIASRLLGTDTVRLLLRHAAGDAKRTAVRQNAAIALGKLCRFEPRCPLTSFYKPHAADYILETSLKEH
ncbi:tetratricopeptide repeat protein 12 isoform X7 [Gymnodraco acuticeps]|uniref:Tetratricopeptide repeat protein 12 isoform X7 n=1 Tax=Gymnodraco acuticeps TaxID=8218 RepID=A0A6P8V0U5_GYMAC|nr:tetratricopeptide repeat protein 12 isoform X7 [Gymnodraco acuticeps]